MYKISGPWPSTSWPQLPPLRDPAPCTRCACSGVYVDYAGPGIVGGVAATCSSCNGRGWVGRNGPTR